MKSVIAGLILGAVVGTPRVIEAQYRAPSQYLRRLPQTQAPPPAAPGTLPPGPTVTPPPTSAPAPTAADAAQADAAKQAAVNRVIEFQKKRAAGGSASAQYALGMRYVQGDGLERNLAEGCKWLRAAAKQDHLWARRKLEELAKELGRLPPDPAPEREAQPRSDGAPPVEAPPDNPVNEKAPTDSKGPPGK